jgi:hypothetical protein
LRGAETIRLDLALISFASGIGCRSDEGQQGLPARNFNINFA